MKKIALFISIVLHPILMPMYAMAIIFFSRNYLAMAVHPKVQLIIFIITAVTTIVFPLISTGILLLRGEISSWHLPLRNERTWPFFYTIIYLLMCFYLVQKLPVPFIVCAVFVSAAIALSMALIINFWFKISIHMVGVGGVIGLMLVLCHTMYAQFTAAIVLATILAGLLGSARLYAGSHKQAHIYAGFLLGFLVIVYTLQFIQ
ncbi:MAG: hypothetical protein JNK61_09830 [Bacteroidia bacterium]|nr:hypothetical protein [Bacteroidia bacterium]